MADEHFLLAVGEYKSINMLIIKQMTLSFM